MSFENRRDAAEKLTIELRKLHLGNSLVVGLARGGVVIGYWVAKLLKLPLSVLVIKKIGAPTNSELAIGAVGSKGKPILDFELIRKLDINKEYLKSEIERCRVEAKRREAIYNTIINHSKVKDKDIVLVDDGIATGTTALAAIKLLRKFRPARIILAVPVAPLSSINSLEKLVDKLIVLIRAADFHAVGQFYRNFEQVDDKQVTKLLEKAKVFL